MTGSLTQEEVLCLFPDIFLLCFGKTEVLKKEINVDSCFFLRKQRISFLGIAISSKRLELAIDLLERGANPELFSDDGLDKSTPLIEAIKVGRKGSNFNTEIRIKLITKLLEK
jgi:hypothetical protein